MELGLGLSRFDLIFLRRVLIFLSILIVKLRPGFLDDSLLLFFRLYFFIFLVHHWKEIAFLRFLLFENLLWFWFWLIVEVIFFWVLYLLLINHMFLQKRLDKHS